MQKTNRARVKQKQPVKEQPPVETQVAEGAQIVGEDAPNTIVTLSDGREVKIEIAKVRHIGKIMSLLTLIFDEISDGRGNVDFDIGETQVLQLVAKLSEKIFDVAHILCNLPRQDLDDLTLDDATDLLMGIWELNKDFFLKNVLPKVSGALTASASQSEDNQEQQERPN